MFAHSVMRELAFYSHGEYTFMTAWFHGERTFGPTKLLLPGHFLL